MRTHVFFPFGTAAQGTALAYQGLPIQLHVQGRFYALQHVFHRLTA